MKVRISPAQCSGHVTIPPSKSMAHRAIICAALAHGKSIITNVAFSQDIMATIEGMRLLGATIETKADSVVVDGIKDFSALQQEEVFCCESGSTLRFFIPLFSLCNQKVRFTGQGRLMQRPQDVYESIFHEQGLTFQQNDKGIVIDASLHHGEFTLQGNVSSQFISGLLFTLPFMKGDSILHIQPPFESKSYVVLTIQMLAAFGVNVYFKDENTIVVPGNQTYKPFHYEIEGDYSQLAFFAVLAAIQNDLTISGVSHQSKQGDKQIIDILKAFNVKVEEVERGYKIYQSPLQATSIDVSNCPDLGPILTVLGMYSPGNTRIFNAGRLRIKESDRIEAMETELKKFGVKISSTDDEIQINGNTTYLCHEDLHGHNDHRVVMALSIAATCSQSACVIDDAQAINKSYPSFFEDVTHLHGLVDIL